MAAKTGRGYNFASFCMRDSGPVNREAANDEANDQAWEAHAPLLVAHRNVLLRLDWRFKPTAGRDTRV